MKQKEEMVKLLKKQKKNNGLADGGFVGLFTSVYLFMESLLKKGGMYTMVLFPIFDAISLRLYWLRSNENGDSINKVLFNRLFLLLKTVASTVGVGLALVGSVVPGFAVLIGGTYAGALRYLGKGLNYVSEGNVKKAESNLFKMIVSGMIGGGFTVLTFYPQMMMLGWSLVLAAVSIIVVPAMPRILTTLMGMNKQDEPIHVNSLPTSVDKKSVLNNQHPGNSSTMIFTNNGNVTANGNNNRQAGADLSKQGPPSSSTLKK